MFHEYSYFNFRIANLHVWEQAQENVHTNTGSRWAPPTSAFVPSSCLFMSVVPPWTQTGRRTVWVRMWGVPSGHVFACEFSCEEYTAEFSSQPLSFHFKYNYSEACQAIKLTYVNRCSSMPMHVGLYTGMQLLIKFSGHYLRLQKNMTCYSPKILQSILDGITTSLHIY